MLSLIGNVYRLTLWIIVSIIVGLVLAAILSGVVYFFTILFTVGPYVDSNPYSGHNGFSIIKWNDGTVTNSLEASDRVWRWFPDKKIENIMYYEYYENGHNPVSCPLRKGLETEEFGSCNGKSFNLPVNITGLVSSDGIPMNGRLTFMGMPITPRDATNYYKSWGPNWPAMYIRNSPFYSGIREQCAAYTAKQLVTGVGHNFYFLDHNEYNFFVMYDTADPSIEEKLNNNYMNSLTPHADAEDKTDEKFIKSYITQ